MIFQDGCNDFKWNAWNATNTPKKGTRQQQTKKKHETENCKASNMEITRTQENAKQSKRQWNYKDFLVKKKNNCFNLNILWKEHRTGCLTGHLNPGQTFHIFSHSRLIKTHVRCDKCLLGRSKLYSSCWTQNETSMNQGFWLLLGEWIIFVIFVIFLCCFGAWYPLITATSSNMGRFFLHLQVQSLEKFSILPSLQKFNGLLYDWHMCFKMFQVLWRTTYSGNGNTNIALDSSQRQRLLELKIETNVAYWEGSWHSWLVFFNVFSQQEDLRRPSKIFRAVLQFQSKTFKNVRTNQVFRPFQTGH